MPERDWRLRIYDITDAIDKIQKYTTGMSFSEFHADDRTIDAVLRNLEVIGEAARHIPPHVTDRPRHSLGQDAGPAQRCRP